MEKQTKKQLFWEIFRFLLVGGTATVVDYFVFWLSKKLLLPTAAWWQPFPLIVAIALGFCAGLLVNWLLSVTFVFRQVTDKEAARSRKSFLLFTIIGVIGLLITELGVLGLVAIFPKFSLFGVSELGGTTWAEWLAKIIMTCIVLVWNYLGRKILVFK